MRPILGGIVPPALVVGRDRFINKIWRALENQSLVLVSFRRTGKTSIIKKMAEEPRRGWRPFFLVIEGVRTPTEFIARIFSVVSPLMSTKNRALVRLEKLYQDISGQKVMDFTLPELEGHWKRLLRAILEDIKENSEDRVLFLWDEFSIMIDNIKKGLGDAAAMEVLDILRDYRMEDNEGKLRMVYTGSVGLHLVLSQLMEGGYKNDPINDMLLLPLEALTPEYARELAEKLLKGLEEEGDIILGGDVGELAAAVAETTDGLPFYINHAVDRLADLDHPIIASDLADAVDAMLRDPNDPAKFGHYAQRIKPYYQFHDRAVELAYAILNHLSLEDRYVSEDDLRSAAAAQVELTRELGGVFETVLTNLLKDHYLTRKIEDSIRKYRFKYNIIRRWWKLNRG